MEKGGLNEIRYFSMFSGVGGFELGLDGANRKLRLERANSLSRVEKGQIQTKDERIVSNISKQNGNGGEQYSLYKCIGYSEVDKYSIQTYQKNFPDHINFGDCTKIDPNELPDFDMLCGGFPCQAFSIAGKRRGFQDTRGTMFFEIARILKVKRPKVIFLENVKGLLNHEKGQTFKVILQTLDELGYNVAWMVLNSKFFGVPQNRERVFIIGSLRGERRQKILPFRESNRKINQMGEAQISNFSPREFGWKNQSPTLAARDYKDPKIVRYDNQEGRDREYKRVYGTEGIAPALHLKTGGWQEPKIVASRGRNPNNTNDRTPGSPTEQRLEVNSEGICNNLTSVQKDHMVLEDMKIRRLTPTECLRLQGFPDNWFPKNLSDTQRYKQMGNAVTVNVIQAIAERLISSP